MVMPPGEDMFTFDLRNASFYRVDDLIRREGGKRGIRVENSSFKSSIEDIESH